MYKDRYISKRIENLLDAFPVVVLCGARQVGKTTLLRHIFPDWDYVVFDPSIDVENARSDPDLFLRNHSSPLILDEIQYAPEVVSAVKRHVDERGGVNAQFILTGSQQWQVIKSIAESLAGRAILLDMFGFSLAERCGKEESASWLEMWMKDQEAFLDSKHERLPLRENLYEILWRGDLPKAVLTKEEMVPDYYSSYRKTYAERDARMLADVSDWHQFGRFLQLAGALTAQEINYSQIGRDIGVTPQTAKRWLRVLEATYQWFEVQPFKGNMIKRVSGKPKAYMPNTGMICHGQQISSPRAIGGHPLMGPLFETAVVNEICKQMGLMHAPPGMHHWRSSGGAEVDLLLSRDGVLYPFEIKSNSRPSRNSASGIHAFIKSHPKHNVAMGAVLAPAENIYRLSDSVVVIPWDLYC
jgi:uncharacterized protein